MAKSSANGRLTRLNNKLAKMANDVFKSPEYRRFLSLPLTPGRAAHYIFERSHFHLNRRQCWALVQAKAPFDVKQIIWHHEREELAGDKERGVENHWVLGMMEGETVGLTAKDFRRPPSDSTMICAYAWAHIAQTAPWLEAISSSAMLEIANSDAIVKGGGIANRIARKMSRELHIPLRRQHSNKEHMEVDVMHANLLSQVAASHVRTKEDADMVLAGATQGLAVNRTWLGLLAGDMAKIA
jgi:pyrroloquinoline quinone (PQQ) biosynthesis protein C